MLHDDLKRLNSYPFHMPGHKRNEDFGIEGSEIDITEINGFDNLHCPAGAIAEIENKLSKIYKADKSFMLVNGSTVGILASILAVTNKGDKIIIARNCHQSVYNACLLNELDVIYAEPEYDEVNGFYKEVSQRAIDLLISENKDAKAVVITSPTYEGFVSSISSPIPLIIDAAHGAHFGFSEFPDYPTADIVISSLHKTLPALTQTAVLNVYNSKYTSSIKKYIDILETSSPSYVLMSSVSRCVELITKKQYLFDELIINLKSFYKTELKHLRFVITDDLSKIVVSTAKANINGTQLAEILRSKYAIECEMASLNYVILMSSICDSKEAFEKLAAALMELDGTITAAECKAIKKPELPEKLFNQHEITATVKTDFYSSVGLTSGETVFAYPPDIPIICKGEKITAEIVEYIDYCLQSGINIISESNLLPDYILTKTDL